MNVPQTNLETMSVYHGYLSWVITLVIVVILSILIWRTLIPFLKQALVLTIDRNERNIKLMLETFEHAINRLADQLSSEIKDVRDEIKQLKRHGASNEKS